METPRWPSLGYGIGLRSEHYDEVLEGDPPVDWFEVISENFIDSGGRPLHVLETVRRDSPVALHGVSLSIGSVDPLDPDYLKKLALLVERIEPALVTDHLCWTAVDHRNIFDLLPLPYTEEALSHVVERVIKVQDALGRQILLENPSTYVEFKHSTIAEADFIAAVAKRADCGILLDINNVYVSAFNHGFDPYEYLRTIPPGVVGQFHLAGFTDRGSYLFDTHSAPVSDAVWDLYRAAVGKFGEVSTLIEWDAEIPPLERLCEEASRAKSVANSCPVAQDQESLFDGHIANLA